MRMDIEYSRKSAFIEEVKGFDVVPRLEEILTKLFDLEKAILAFDSRAFQPSKLVRFVVNIILHAKQIVITVIMAIIIVAVKEYLGV